MVQSKSLSSSLTPLLLIFLLGVCSAHGQVRWACMPVQFDSQTRTMFVDSADSTLYIAGQYTEANGQPHHRIVGMRPDGSLKPMPPSPLDGPVVFTRWNGKLMVGGFGGLAEYDGTSWHKVDSSGTPFALYPYQGKLLVGGSFIPSPWLSSANRVLMEWDGATMKSFKGLDSIFTSYAINSIVEYRGDLIVAGNVDPYAPVSPRFKEIVRWTGTSWQPLGNGISGGGLDVVTDMKVINDELYVAGYFFESNGSPGNSITKWDGVNWHRLDGGIPTHGVFDLEMQGDTLIMVGGFQSAGGKPARQLARYWKGHWCNNDVTTNSGLTCAINYFGTVVVTGGFTTVGSNSCGYLAKITSWGDCFKQAAGILQSDSGLSALQVYPNPAQDRATVHYNATQQGTARIKVLDVLGRPMLVNEVVCRPGANQVSIDLTPVPAGLYTVQISNSEGHGAIKIVKQ